MEPSGTANPSNGAMKARLPRLRDRMEIAGSLGAVSPICLGISPSSDVVVAAYERGCNFFFVSCDMHWPLYEGTRRGIAELVRANGRESIVVAAVAYVTQPEFQRAPFEELLEAVQGLERIDLVVAGGAYSSDLVPRLNILRNHRRLGTFGVRGVAASFHDRAAAQTSIEAGLVDLAFVRFNAAHPGARRDLFPSTTNTTPPVFTFKSMSGFVEAERLAELGIGDSDWQPRPEDHYRYALSHAGVDGILCALKSTAEIDALDEALNQGPLDAGEGQYMEKLCLLDQGVATLA